MSRPSVSLALVGALMIALHTPASAQALLADFGSDLESVGADGTISTYLPGVNAQPLGLAFDTSNNLYVVNRVPNGTITMVTPQKVVTTFASGLSTPVSIVFDGGNLYVTNSGNGVVNKITLGGVVSTFATGLSSPQGIALFGNTLYVANGSAGSISKITSTGLVSTFVTGLSSPSGLVFDPSGNLYVASQTASGITSKVSPSGTITLFASGLYQPEGLAIDTLGNLYAADDSGTFASTIKRITPSGSVSTFATGGFPNGGSYLAFSPTLQVPGSPEPGAPALFVVGGVTGLIFSLRRRR